MKGHLTVEEAAERLGKSAGEVHLLIQADELKAILREEEPEPFIIPEPALDAYLARLDGEKPNTHLPEISGSQHLSPDLNQPIGDDPHLIAVRDQTVRSLKLGYGMDGVGDACRAAELTVEGYPAEPLPSRSVSLHVLKRKISAALEAGYGIEEIGDAIAEAEILFTKHPGENR